MEDEFETTSHHYHYFDEFRGSFALISPSQAVSTALVFVHGFGGNAYGTWNDFHLMVDDTAWSSRFSDSDLFFFTYRSILERIQSSTDRLLTFLDQVIFRPQSRHFSVSLNPLLVVAELGSAEPQSTQISALPQLRQYRRVVLVGHSEGGVVIRNAIDKKAGKNSPVLNCRVCLFAPAIGGYAPAGLAGVLANSPFFGKVLDGLLRGSPAYQDLNKADLLQHLRKRTERNARKYRSQTGFRAFIVWGRTDYVVNPEKYAQDEEQFEEQGHRKLCKPDDIYFSPLDLVSTQGVDL